MSNRTSNNNHHVSLQNHQCLRHMYHSHAYSVLVKKKLGLSICFIRIASLRCGSAEQQQYMLILALWSQSCMHHKLPSTTPCRLLGMSCPSPFSLGLVLSNFTLEEVPWRKTLTTWQHDSKLRNTGGCKYLACMSSLLALNIRCKAGTMSQLVWHTGSSECVHNSSFWSTTMK